MGLADWFRTFCRNIQVSNRTTISMRYKAITRRLNTDFWATTSDASHSLYVGSYGRRTAIDGTSDVDVIFRLPYAVYQQYNSHAGNGQSALLQAVRASIKQTYPRSIVGADGQIVAIPFDDGITFELVPGFLNDSGSYTYPDSNGGGSWRTTNPKPEIEAVRAGNGACNNNLIPLCRMMRSWKMKWSVPVNGLLIDTLAYRFIRNWTYRDKSYLYYDFMCRDFFDFMADQDIGQTTWSALGSGQRISNSARFQHKARRCYNIALKAIEHETARPKQEWSAKQKWREIFGTSFPD